VTSDYEFRAAVDDDWPIVSKLMAEAFNDEMDDDWNELEHSVFEPARSIVATQSGAIVGMVSAFTRDLTVPGGVVPAAHVTMVNVGATHRRQGLLRRMIDKLHADSIGLGEPIAVLYASEGRIYQRFGYGPATQRLTIEANAREVALRDSADYADADDGRLRSVPADSLDVFEKVFEEARADRPGWTARDERWWRYCTADIKSIRGGATSLRAVVHDGPGGVDGYMLWRAKGEWSETGPNGQVIVRELIATTPEAYRALWRFALSVDLTRSARQRFAAIDEPLQFLVNEPQALGLRVVDGLWLRLLDVPTALAARRYAAPIDVVIEVKDPNIPANAGRVRLVGDERSATCTRTDEPADIEATAHALGSAYLGGAPLTAFAAGGGVRELRPDTLARASVAFGWHRAPSSIEMF
jgi:predicted acetyltransferase